MREQEFYLGDIAHWEVSHEGGKPVFVEVEVVGFGDPRYGFGGKTYIIEPVAGLGRATTRKLSKLKKKN